MTGTTSLPTAQAGTGLSPEWDRWFDEAFTDLIGGDDDLVRAEFDALIGASWHFPPPPPASPAPSMTDPDEQGEAGRGDDSGGDKEADIADDRSRPPP